MEAASEQPLPGTSGVLDVCQALQQKDLTQSCKSIELNFIQNLENASLKLLRNLNHEWNSAVEVNSDLSKPENIAKKENLMTRIFVLLELFQEKCKAQQANAMLYLPQISELRQQYLSKLTSYNETLREFIMNETNEIRSTLTELEIAKDSLRRDHNQLLIKYNKEILDLQLQLDHFKQGIINVIDPTSNQEQTEFMFEFIEKLRSLCVFPGETTEEKIARDTEFNTWKELLRLPSKWLIEVQSPQPEVPERVPIDLNIDAVPHTSDPAESSPPIVYEITISPISEREFKMSSPNVNEVNIPPSLRLDETNIPVVSSPPAPEPQELSPAFTSRSSESSPHGSDEFQSRDSVRDTPVYRKHIKNQHLLRRVKTAYGKLRSDVRHYTATNRFSDKYREIQQLNATIQDLSREWRTLREVGQEEQRTDETRDRERGERAGHSNVQRTSMKSVNQIYNEWREVRHSLRNQAIRIDEDWNKITELQRSLETLYAEMEGNGNHEQILAAEERINRDLIELRRKSKQLKIDVKKLKSLEHNLSEQLQKLKQNLQRRKTTLERKIADSRNPSG